MSASSIRKKIKKGLAKAIAKTGSSESDIVYKVVKTQTSGGSSPLDLPVFTPSLVELTNAIFKEYKTEQFNDNIKKGDRQLVVDNDTVIEEGDIIRHGTQDHTVVAVDIKAPTSDALVYIAQVRAK